MVAEGSSTKPDAILLQVQDTTHGGSLLPGIRNKHICVLKLFTGIIIHCELLRETRDMNTILGAARHRGTDSSTRHPPLLTADAALNETFVPRAL